MSEKSKRYYWFRFLLSFFSQDEHVILESMPDGKMMLLLYIKFMSIAAKHEGYLIITEEYFYDIETLASATHETVELVEATIKALMNLGLVTKDESGKMFLPEVPELIGSETQYAAAKRAYRDKKKTMSGQCPNETTSGQSPTENREQSENNNKTNIEEREEDNPSPQHHLGQFNNVILTDENIDYLKTFYEQSVWTEYIERLSRYKESSGKSFNNDFATIVDWIERDGV